MGRMAPEDAVRPASGRFYLGCAVWAHAGWVGSFYPPGTRPERFLELYSRRLTAVEGNTTFYSVPAEETLRNWRRRMREGFRFLPKLPRAVTHEGPLVPRLDEAGRFAWTVAALGSRLGPCFAQLPRTYGTALARDLDGFLSEWPKGAPPLFVEVRNREWFEGPWRERLAHLLAGRGAGRVVLDSRAIYERGAPAVRQERRKPDVPVVARATARRCMVRFVGHPELARNGRFLDQWAARVHRWLEDGREVYWFAHCPVEDRSPAIARELQRRLEERGAPVERLPWDGVAGQGALFRE